MSDAPPSGTESPRERDIRENKDIAAVSYIWVMSIIIYFARKDSAFIHYHARQGVVLFLISLPLWFIPVVGNLLEFFILAGMVMGFINAFQGHYTDVPVIGALAKGELTPMQALKKAAEFFRGLFAGMLGKKDAKKQDVSPSPPPEL